MRILRWPDMIVGEKEIFGCNWANAIGRDPLQSVDAEVLSGGVIVNGEADSYIARQAIQAVWVEATAVGTAVVRLSGTTEAGQIVKEDVRVVVVA